MTSIAVKHVQLELARADLASDGPGNSYELQVPLLLTGALDMAQFHIVREDCRAVRRRLHRPDCLAPVRPLGNNSLLADFSHCDGAGTMPTQFYFDRLVEGSFISIRDSDNLLRTFCVTAVTTPASVAHGFTTR